MKKRGFFLVVIIVEVFLAGCGSSPSTPVNTNSQSSLTGADTNFSFNGFWELPNGQLQYFINNVYMSMDNEGGVGGTGIFTHTNTQFTLNIDPGVYRVFDYTVVNSETITVTGTSNSWAHGNWIKHDEISWPASDHPIVGYWERKTEEQVLILLITSLGWGDHFTCDTEYKLAKREEISYDEDNHTEFRTRETLFIDPAPGGIVSYFYSSMKYVFDGDDLLAGYNNDISTYKRYIRK
jgi:hypothetical protein